MIYSALTTEPGKLLHQWLINNFLMTPTVTHDPNAALWQVAQSSLIASINTRFARHLDRGPKE